MCLHRAAFLNSITYLNSNVIPLKTSISVRTVSKFLKFSRDPRSHGPYRRYTPLLFMAAYNPLNQEFLSTCTGNSSIPYGNSDRLNS